MQPISVIIVNFNGREHLAECLNSVLNQFYPNYEVILVDNCSSDGSVQYVQKTFPKVRVIENYANLGYGGGNNVGYKNAHGEFIAVLNPDTVVAENWLNELANAFLRKPDAKIVTSKILLYDDQRRINACGNDIHFTGLVFSRRLGEKDGSIEEEYVTAPSGCSFMVSKELIEEMGFFDTELLQHWLFEDTDLAIRLQLRGYRCFLASSSKVYHKFGLKMTPQRYFMLERGRYLLLLKNLDQKFLIILLPSLALTEVLTWGFAILKGRKYVMAKIAAYAWIKRNRLKISMKRETTQKLKRISDGELLKEFSYKIHVPKSWINNEGLRKGIEKAFNLAYYVIYNITSTILA